MSIIIRVGVLRDVVRNIGKHQLMADLRDSDYMDTFAEGDWESYAETIDDWLATTIKCFNCGRRYSENEVCVCSNSDELEWSFA